MRSVSFAALVVLVFALASEGVSGQSKDKDSTKDSTKDSMKDAAGKWPTEILGKDLDKWIVEIKDPDAGNRQIAIRTVVQFGPAGQKALSALAGRLYSANEPDAAVRADAIIAIRLFGLAHQDKKVHDYVISSLAEALSDSQRSIRVQAVTSLGQLGTDARGAIAKLAGTLQDPASWEVRAASARALGAVGRGEKAPDDKAVNALINPLVLGDLSVSVRMAVISALSVLGSTEKLLPTEKRALEDRLIKEKDHRVKIWVRTLLMFLDEKGHMTKANFDAILKDLDNEDARVRAQAVQALGTLGKNADKQPGVAAALTKTLSDRDLDVRLAAVTALPHLGNSCIGVMTRMLKDEQEDMAIRTQVARSMWVLGKDGRAFMDELIALLGHKDPEVVLAAINGLVAFGELAQPAIPALKKYDPAILSFDEHIKKVNKTLGEEATQTRESVKTAAEEAAKHLGEYKPPKK